MKDLKGLLCLFIVLQSSLIYSQHIISEKWYGGNYKDEGAEGVNMSDGGFLITGIYNQSYYNDIYLIRTNANGDTLWTKTYGGSSWDNGFSINPTYDNNYIIGGRTFSSGSATSGDAYLLKVSPNGDYIRESKYGSSTKDGCTSVLQASDSGYVFTGQYNNSDFWVFKSDSAGIEQWSKTFGAGFGYKVIETSDQNYLVTGFIGSPNNMYIAKLNAVTGDTIWTKTLGGSGMDRGYSICNSYNDGFMVVGFTGSEGAGGYDIYLAELNADGDTVSTKTYGFTENETGYSICQGPDSSYLVAASTSSIGEGLNDIYLLKLDANLDTLWTETYGGVNNDWPNQIFLSSDSHYVVIGTTESYGTPGDVYFLKIGEYDPTGIETRGKFDRTTSKYQLSQNYPNPFNPKTIFSYQLPVISEVNLSIYNLLGQRIATLIQEKQQAGSYQIEWNATGFASGIYLYRLQTDNFIQTKKLVLLK